MLSFIYAASACGHVANAAAALKVAVQAELVARQSLMAAKQRRTRTLRLQCKYFCSFSISLKQLLSQWRLDLLEQADRKGWQEGEREEEGVLPWQRVPGTLLMCIAIKSALRVLFTQRACPRSWQTLLCQHTDVQHCCMLQELLGGRAAGCSWQVAKGQSYE